MLKYVLLASAVAIASPALAQDVQQGQQPPATQAPPPVDTTEPDASDEIAPVTQSAPAQSDESVTTTEPAEEATNEATEEATTPEPQASEPNRTAQATPEQVAQLIDKDFASYDKDGDGSLNTEEFGAWMVALRSATEPAFTGQSDADKQWITKALAAADTDKSGGVSNPELKGFLAPQTAAS